MNLFYPDPTVTARLDEKFAECRRLHWKMIADQTPPISADQWPENELDKIVERALIHGRSFFKINMVEGITMAQFNNQLAVEGE